MKHPSPATDAFFHNVFRHIRIDQHTLRSLTPELRVREYPRKSYLLTAGERWNKLFFIQHGLIRLFYADLGGKEFNKSFFREQQCIWPVAPYDREQQALFNVAAVEKTLVIECPFQSLYDLLNQHGLWTQFALPFAEKLIEQKFQREHDFLLLSATERFEKFSVTYPDIVRRLPDYHLASYLGITNVSLSRIKRAASR